MALMTPHEYRLREDLKFSKSSYMPWGRLVIRAIDFDDCVSMVQTFETRAALGAHVDVQATSENYGGYVWSAWITNFVGDTALHMALRQKKMKCAYMLIAMGAVTDIENSRGQTAEDIITKSLGKTVRQMELDAFREVIPLLDPMQLKYLPKRSTVTHVNFPTVEREAWDMMTAGRSMYVETPKCFEYDDIIPDPKAAGKPRPRKWATRYDTKTKRKYRIDAYSGEIEWLKEEEKKVSIKDTPVVLNAPPPSSKKVWAMAFDEQGNKYYHNSVTGESQWEVPDELKSKAQLEKEAKERKKKERADAGLSDSDEEYEYKKAGESDSEDEEEKLAMLRRQREKEEQERIDAIGREERERKQKEREEWSRRNQEKRKAQRAHERATGVNICAGAEAVGDVWGKNSVTDTIRLLHKQRLRQKRMNEADAHRLSGLTLMNAASKEETPGLSRDLLHGLREMKGVRRLRFGKLKELSKLAKEIEENPDPRADLELPYRFVDTLSTRTNLKAMSVSDFGLSGIAAELVDDRVIVHMELFGAGVSLRGSQALAKTLPTMRALTALDLSANAIDDDAALALASGLRAANEGAAVDNGYDDNPDDTAVAESKAKYGSLLGHLPLIKLSLSGNRVTLPGAKAIVREALDDRSTLRFVSLTNNFLRPEEREELSRMVGPHHDYTRGQQRYAKRYAFPGPGGKTMKWPFHFYPFPKHPLHPSNNATEEDIEYYRRVENSGRPVSGVNRGDPWPESGTWEPLELRMRLANRQKALMQREHSRPLERRERQAMNEQRVLSKAEFALAEEDEDRREREQRERRGRESSGDSEGGVVEGDGTTVAPQGATAAAPAAPSYTQEELAADPALQLELEALHSDIKVTAMTKREEKILHASPRQEASVPDDVAATDGGAGGESHLRSALKKKQPEAEMTPLKVEGHGASRKVLFQDEVEAGGGYEEMGDHRVSEADPLLSSEDAKAEARAQEMRRERAAYESAGSSEADVEGISADVSAFGQETLAPGRRGPPHLRQLDILI